MAEETKEVSTNVLVDSRQAAAVGRRRRWPEALKRRIVSETLEPGSSVSIVARRHDVNANQLFRWRRAMLATSAGALEGGAVLPVRIVPEEGGGRRPADRAGVIEIAFGSGARVFVGDGVAPETLRQVIDLLRRR
jgi:transposase